MVEKLIALLGVLLLAVQLNAKEVGVFKSEKEKVSYALGVELARNLKKQAIDVDGETLMKGVRDGLSGKEMLLTEEGLQATLSSLQAELRRKQEEAMRKVGEENRKAGDAFLQENKSKDGVVTLESGLQYQIIKAGEGKKPGDGDSVECNYRGTLINGTEFDSSYKKGQPATFMVKGGIKGFNEAIQLMPVGSKWKLFIPPQLAYGERGVGEVGPNATIILEVELLAIK